MSHALLQKFRMVTASRQQQETKDAHVLKLLREVVDCTESTAECEPDELVEVRMPMHKEEEPKISDSDDHFINISSSSSGDSGSTASSGGGACSTSCSTSSEDKSGCGDENTKEDNQDEETKQIDPEKEKLNAAVVELEHEVREKASQCEILRETLSSMSVTMKDQAQQIKAKNAELEEHKKLMKEKSEECEAWKEKYNKLAASTKETTASGATSSPPLDPLLADPALSVYTNRPRGQSVRSNRNQFTHAPPISDDDDGEDSANDTENEDVTGAGPYEFAKNFGNGALDLVMRSTTNRARSYRPKKRKPAEVGAMKKVPMTWIGNGDVVETDDDDKPKGEDADAKKINEETVEFLNKVMDESQSFEGSALSLTMYDAVESDSGEVQATIKAEEKTLKTTPHKESRKTKKKRTEAERRRARVRRVAKREARRAEFEIQQLDV